MGFYSSLSSSDTIFLFLNLLNKLIINHNLLLLKKKNKFFFFNPLFFFLNVFSILILNNANFNAD